MFLKILLLQLRPLFSVNAPRLGPVPQNSFSRKIIFLLTPNNSQLPTFLFILSCYFGGKRQNIGKYVSFFKWMDINTTFRISHLAVVLMLSMYNIFKLWTLIHNIMYINIATKITFLINVNQDNMLHFSPAIILAC